MSARLRPSRFRSACRSVRIVSLLAALLLACAPFAHADVAEPDDTRDPAQLLLHRVNAERARHGVAALAWDPELAAMARAHSQDMCVRQQCTHDSADGSHFVDRVAAAGIHAKRTAENVATAPDVETAHRALMDSPHHRDNILDERLDALGVGVVADTTGQVWVTEDFSRRSAALPEREAARALAATFVASLRRSSTALPTEDPTLSARLQRAAEELASRDACSADGLMGEACWIQTWVSTDPTTLPDSSRSHCHGSHYGIGVAWRHSPKQPMGAYWVVLALEP